MRLCTNQVNPNTQLDAMYAAQRAAAKREAEKTRKKLTEFASALAGEAEGEGFVVQLGERESAEEETRRQNLPQGRKGRESEDSEEEGSISDWA
jgi:hypothetical protein